MRVEIHRPVGGAVLQSIIVLTLTALLIAVLVYGAILLWRKMR